MKTALPWLALLVVVLIQVAVLTSRRGEAPAATVDHRITLERIDARLDRLEEQRGLPELATPRSLAGAAPERVAAVDAGGRRSVNDDLAARLAALEGRLAALEGTRIEGEQRVADRARLARLNAALEKGDFFEAQRLLVEENLDPNAKDHDGQTPLAAAAISGKADVVDLMLDHGADLERKSKRGMTPLLAALDADQGATALQLLDRGSDPEAVDKNGETPLMWASYNGLNGVLDRLVATGVKLDWKNHEGRTALMSAARKGRLESVRKLLAAGADPNLEDKGGATAFSLAKGKKNKRIMKLLEEYGRW